jgi:predicted GIY-YIG superfamily endonuclease
MAPPKFSLTRAKDERLIELVKTIDHRTLAAWAIDCTVHVLPYFEDVYPEDHRPRNAIETLQTWMRTGVFKMAVIRKASLDAHAAAREVGGDNAARSAARAAGQAVATAHVPTHSMGSAIYALQAVYRAANSLDADAAVTKERDWQYKHLLKLGKTTTEAQWFFYMVRCNDNSLYSGMTNNLKERVKKHNDGTGAKYTSSHKPVTLVYSERHTNASEAKKRENEVKGWPKHKKETLVSNGTLQQKGKS